MDLQVARRGLRRREINVGRSTASQAQSAIRRGQAIAAAAETSKHALAGSILVLLYGGTVSLNPWAIHMGARGRPADLERNRQARHGQRRLSASCDNQSGLSFSRLHGLHQPVAWTAGAGYGGPQGTIRLRVYQS
jgi:hypothetical protein